MSFLCLVGVGLVRVGLAGVGLVGVGLVGVGLVGVESIFPLGQEGHLGDWISSRPGWGQAYFCGAGASTADIKAAGMFMGGGGFGGSEQGSKLYVGGLDYHLQVGNPFYGSMLFHNACAPFAFHGVSCASCICLDPDCGPLSSTQEANLREIFSSFGELDRVLLPFTNFHPATLSRPWVAPDD